MIRVELADRNVALEFPDGTPTAAIEAFLNKEFGPTPPTKTMIDTAGIPLRQGMSPMPMPTGRPQPMAPLAAVAPAPPPRQLQPLGFSDQAISPQEMQTRSAAALALAKEPIGPQPPQDAPESTISSWPVPKPGYPPRLMAPGADRVNRDLIDRLPSWAQTIPETAGIVAQGAAAWIPTEVAGLIRQFDQRIRGKSPEEAQKIANEFKERLYRMLPLKSDSPETQKMVDFVGGWMEKVIDKGLEVTKTALGSMISGPFSREVEDERLKAGPTDPLLEDLTDFALTLGLFRAAHGTVTGTPKLVRGIAETVRNSDWYRRATIPERGVVVQDAKVILKNLRDAGYPEAEIARKFPSEFDRMMQERGAGSAADAVTPKMPPEAVKMVQTEVPYAQGIREDAGQVPERGLVQEGRPAEGRPDMELPAPQEPRRAAQVQGEEITPPSPLTPKTEAQVVEAEVGAAPELPVDEAPIPEPTTARFSTLPEDPQATMPKPAEIGKTQVSQGPDIWTNAHIVDLGKPTKGVKHEDKGRTIKPDEITTLFKENTATINENRLATELRGKWDDTETDVVSIALLTPNGEWRVVNPKYIAYFKGKYPDAKFYLGDAEKPVIVVSGGKPVGLIAPFSEKAKLVSLEDAAYSIPANAPLGKKRFTAADLKTIKGAEHIPKRKKFTAPELTEAIDKAIKEAPVDTTDGVVEFYSPTGESWGYKISNNKGILETFKARVEKSGAVLYDRAPGGTAVPAQGPPSPPLQAPPTGDSIYDHGTYADIPVTALQLPEIVDLAKRIFNGKYPRIVKRLSKDKTVMGSFSDKTGTIRISAAAFKNIDQAIKTVAHELGHLNDWLPKKDLNRGNILGRIASLQEFTGKFVPEYPGGPGWLTRPEREVLLEEARKQLKTIAEREVDEIISRTIPITPDDVLAIWNSVEPIIREGNRALYEYVAQLSMAEKKAVVTAALKGELPESIQQFSKIVQEPTGRKIRAAEETTDKAIRKRFRELIEEELKRRHVIWENPVTEELKWFTSAWKPFDVNADPKYTEYRFSGKELYADAFSAALVNPAFLKDHAPIFYKAFFNYLENKPKLFDLYNGIIEEIHSGAIVDTRNKNLEKGFSGARAAYSEAIKRELTAVPKKEAWMVAFVNRYWSTIRRTKELGQDSIPPALDPSYRQEDFTYRASWYEGYLKDFKYLVMKPLEKANITLDEFGRYAFHSRVVGERGELANPLGWNLKDSQIELDRMNNSQHGPALRQLLDAFIKVRREYILPLVQESQMYPLDVENKIMSNRYYFTFDIVNHIDASANARIYKQIGTFKETANPIEATLSKDLAIMHAALRNIAARTTIDMMEYGYPQEIKPANVDVKIDGRKHARMSSDLSYGLLTYKDRGETVASYVPRLMADSFKDRDPVELRIAAQVMRITATTFRSIFTEFNPAFQPYNVVRDYLRLARNIGLDPIRVLPWYLKGTKTAFRSVFLANNEITKEMYREGDFISVMERRGELAPDTVVAERLLKQMKLRPSIMNKYLKPFNAFFYFMASSAKFIERTPKAAAFHYYKEMFPDMDPRKRAHRIRGWAGSPAFLNRGTLSPYSNTAVLFSNAQVHAILGDAEAFKASPASWTFNIALYSLIPKLLQYAAIMGLLGFGIKEIMEGIPDSDKTNYLCVPLGLTPSKKSVYLRIPQDQTGQFFAGIFWKTLPGSEDGNIGDLFNYGTEQLPSLNPAITLSSDLIYYLGGGNPTDTYRKQPAIPDQIFKAGGMRSHEALMKYMADQAGVRIVYNFRSDDLDIVKTDLEGFLGYPIVGNIVGRFVKVSDRGLTEKFDKVQQEIEKRRANEILTGRDTVIKMFNGDPISEKDVAALIPILPTLKDEIVKMGVRKYGTAFERSYLRAGSNEAKLSIISEFIKLNQRSK